MCRKQRDPDEERGSSSRAPRDRDDDRRIHGFAGRWDHYHVCPGVSIPRYQIIPRFEYQI